MPLWLATVFVIIFNGFLKEGTIFESLFFCLFFILWKALIDNGDNGKKLLYKWL